MDLQARLEDVQKRFVEAQDQLKAKQDLIQRTNNEIVEISAEMNRMQGEYRVLNDLMGTKAPVSPVESAPAEVIQMPEVVQ